MTARTTDTVLEAAAALLAALDAYGKAADDALVAVAVAAVTLTALGVARDAYAQAVEAAQTGN